MAGWLRSLMGREKPQASPVTVRRYGPENPVLSLDMLTPAEGGWSIAVSGPATARLFEVSGLDAERCLLLYRAAMRAEGLDGRAFLEMWVRVPGKGEFFSKGLDQPVRGTTDWASYEIPFRLLKGQSADFVKLNVAVEGRGKVWIRDVELLKIPQ